MKLVRFGSSGNEKPGVLYRDGTIRDLSGMKDRVAGDLPSDEWMDSVRALDIDTLPEVPGGTRIGPCIAPIGKVVCVGLNYLDHAREAKAEPPAEPVIFFKASTAINGPNDDIVLPPGSTKTDWEIELGVVIGRTARGVSEREAMAHIAGYCIVNDVSERHWQLERGGQWVKGKSFDTFCPIGPWLVTRDEVLDPGNLTMQLEVNDHCYQRGSTSDMIFNVTYLVSYLSHLMTLQPGDLISTGTPAGVGLGQTPPSYLTPGDTVTLEIAGLGKQRQRVRGSSSGVNGGHVDVA